jgi:hypothetical protein
LTADADADADADNDHARVRAVVCITDGVHWRRHPCVRVPVTATHRMVRTVRNRKPPRGSGTGVHTYRKLPPPRRIVAGAAVALRFPR